MTVLAWSGELALGHAVMDETHKEFVALLNAVAEAQAGDVLASLDAFIAHTEAHFGQEDAWMAEREFPRQGCHRAEHRNVLEVMREVRSRVAGGEAHYARTLAEALGEWFQVHATTMDAMLAVFMEHGLEALPECSHEGSESCPNSGAHEKQPASAPPPG